jgi:glycerate 2-kinase
MFAVCSYYGKIIGAGMLTQGEIMKFIFASDSFKGSLSSRRIGELLAAQSLRVFPDCEITALPMADGGEGTMDALVSIRNGEYMEFIVKGPLWNDMEARIAVLDRSAAVIEMAEASGLTLVPKEKRNPLETTTYGTGQLIANALDSGYRDIIIGVGGSATNDGGIGAASALGIRFLDSRGNEVVPVGKSLGEIVKIDMSGIHPAVRESKFTVMCDISNPLTGPSGATYTFGPQKGANDEQLAFLEAGMVRFSQIVKSQFGIDLSAVKGAGAAGGLSAGLMVFLSASLRSGIETILELCRFDELLKGTDFVVTGEGHIDSQTAFGKVIHGIGMACKKRGVPCAAVVGGMGIGAEKLYDCGITSIIPTVRDIMSLDEAMERAEELYTDAAYRMFSLFKAGAVLK